MYKTLTSAFIILFIFAGCSNKNIELTHNLKNKKEGIYSLKQAKRISIDELTKQLEPYSIILVGDHHNNKKTHDFLNELLLDLSNKGFKINLVNEWFTPKHDSLLLDYTSNKITSEELKEKRDWDKFTKYKWELVSQLYKTVKNSEGRLYGMNISKEKREKISLKQFNKMDKEEKSFYDNLDLNISAHQQLVMPYLKHCNKLPQKSTEACEERMYRVQVAWDTYMAQNINKLAKKVIKTSKDKIVVFVGAMHIEQGLGIPLRFSRLNETPFITISNKKIDKESALKIEVNKADIVYMYE